MKAAVLGSLLAAAAAIVRTNWLQSVAVAGTTPDLALIIIVYVANKNGPMIGQVTGFASGIVQDLLSTAPLGFNALHKLIIGFISGRTHGTMYIDPVLMPALLVLGATLLKGLVGLMLGAVFGLAPAVQSVLSTAFAVETAYNALLAPPAFGLLSLIRRLEANRSPLRS